MLYPGRLRRLPDPAQRPPDPGGGLRGGCSPRCKGSGGRHALANTFYLRYDGSKGLLLSLARGKCEPVATFHGTRPLCIFRLDCIPGRRSRTEPNDNVINNTPMLKLTAVSPQRINQRRTSVGGTWSHILLSWLFLASRHLKHNAHRFALSFCVNSGVCRELSVAKSV